MRVAGIDRYRRLVTDEAVDALLDGIKDSTINKHRDVAYLRDGIAAALSVLHESGVIVVPEPGAFIPSPDPDDDTVTVRRDDARAILDGVKVWDGGALIRLHPGLVPMSIEECVQRLERELGAQRERINELEIRAGIVLPPQPPIDNAPTTELPAPLVVSNWPETAPVSDP